MHSLSLRRSRSPSLRLMLGVAMGAAIALSLVTLWLVHEADDGSALSYASTAPALPLAMPNFSLLDQDGAKVSRAALLGHAWVADVIYLQCGSTCAVLNRAIAGLEKETAADAAMRFVSFSIDPSDGPRSLKRYEKQNLAGRDARWRLLAADQSAYPEIAQALGVVRSAADVRRGQLAVSQLFFLVDAQGIVRSAYDGTRRDEVERLARDLRAAGAGASR